MNDKELEPNVDESTPAVEEKPVVEETPAVEKKSAPAPEPAPEAEKKGAPAAAKNAAVSGNGIDDVLLSQCIYKNAYARKSLTVHHVQRRLVEWGYNDAGADKDGWYGDLTKSAVAAFQNDHGIASTGDINASTLLTLFTGDDNVRVVL